MYSYARSGGTLFNKCLSSLPNTIVISEIHPDGGGFGTGGDPYLGTVHGQASQWYGIDLQTKGYKNQILELLDYCNKNGKTLILRDWIYLSFNVNKIYQNKPSFSFDTYKMFKGEVPITTFALVRNAVDVWISMGRKAVDEFIVPYEMYISQLLDLKIPWYRYEDFVREPANVMHTICDQLQINYSDNFLVDFNNNKALGDTYVSDNYRTQKKKIQPQQRKPITPVDLYQFSQQKVKFLNVNKPFGYQTTYFNEDNNLIAYLKNISSKVYKNLLKNDQ